MTRFLSIVSQFNLVRWLQTQLDGTEIHNAKNIDCSSIIGNWISDRLTPDRSEEEEPISVREVAESKSVN